jgi:type IV pilus assembly protein PilA
MRSQAFSNSQRGFSLIELMVVVSIIAVLAAIAIPRVNRFVAKSRTSEAQVNLSSIYTFNKNFYVEYQGYTPYFTAMGYLPEGRLRYNVGFNGTTNCPPAYDLTYDCSGAITSLAYCGQGVGTGETGCDIIPGPDNTVQAIPAASGCDNTGFTARAIAKLVAGTDNDQWSINQDKNLNNVNDGTDGL